MNIKNKKLSTRSILSNEIYKEKILYFNFLIFYFLKLIVFYDEKFIFGSKCADYPKSGNTCTEKD